MLHVMTNALTTDSEQIEVLSPTRSTKGASKQRRDLINTEIENLKDVMPLPDTIRQRLFQLQVMSLTCIYIRKERYVPHVLGLRSSSRHYDHFSAFDFAKTLKGFVILITRQGKLLYISENVADYLGHSVEEILSQGDSLYDIIDYRDHAAVQTELLSGPPSLSLGYGVNDEKVFLCRMTLSRAARRQPQYQKFVIIRGRYLHPAEYYQALMNLSGAGPYLHPVFAGLCGPLITPETADSLLAGHTSIFSAVHNMDMKFVHVDHLCEYHLGYPNDYLRGRSWYAFLHPNDVRNASAKHKQLCDDKETSCILLVRLKSVSGAWLWLHTVLCLREGCVHDENVQHQIIMATYQMLGDIEASTIAANRWIYQPLTTGQPSSTMQTGSSFLFSEASPRMNLNTVPGGLHQRSKSEDFLAFCANAGEDLAQLSSTMPWKPGSKRRGSKQSSRNGHQRNATGGSLSKSSGRKPPRRSSLTTQLEVFHEASRALLLENADDASRVETPSSLALTPAAIGQTQAQTPFDMQPVDALLHSSYALTPPDTSPSGKSSTGSSRSRGSYRPTFHHPPQPPPQPPPPPPPPPPSASTVLSHPTLLRQVDDTLPEIDSSLVEDFFRNVEQGADTPPAWLPCHAPQSAHVQPHPEFSISEHAPMCYNDVFYRYHAGSNGSAGSSTGSVGPDQLLLSGGLHRPIKYESPPEFMAFNHAMVPPLPVFTYESNRRLSYQLPRS